jgi:hypothetical protein
MARKKNDGDELEVKIDKFRNSRFEHDVSADVKLEEGVSVKTINTIGGPWEENRGHRVADEAFWNARPESPFENGKLRNWNHKTGWEQYYTDKSLRNGRQGGALIGPNISAD